MKSSKSLWRHSIHKEKNVQNWVSVVQCESVWCLAQALDIEIESKEQAFAKFEAKDKELVGKIEVQMGKEEELRKQLEKVQEERRALEEERELRGAMQDKANVVRYHRP